MRLRTAVLLLLSLLPAIAADTCFRFFPDSHIVVDGYRAYAVAKNRFVSLHCPAGKKIVAQDRLKGLCIFESPVRQPFHLADPEPPLHFCPSATVRYVEILSTPFSIYPGRLKRGYGEEGALFGECCELVGIVEADGRWFDRGAITMLLRGETRHGDVGIRLDPGKEPAVIRAVDPFAGTALRPGDRLLAVGGRHRPTFRSAEAAIDRCRPGHALSVTLQRGKARRTERLRCLERRGGGRLSDTFLERFGLWFDRGLAIVRIDEGGKAYETGLRRGDRLLQIDRNPVHSPAEVRKVLTGYAVRGTLPERLLWERDGFQFFLPLPSL